MFEFFPAPREPGATIDPQRSADYFNWYLDLWPRAELLGYEGIFFSEHHFRPAYSPAPNLLIAQVALKTRTIRLGVMGLVPPYHQPWKIVEEIGMLDHLTQGRLEVGTAAGIPQEMARVGMSVEEAREHKTRQATSSTPSWPDRLSRITASIGQNHDPSEFSGCRMAARSSAIGAHQVARHLVDRHHLGDRQAGVDRR